MSNLEHLIENGLCRLSEGKSYKEWREIMQDDCNWENNENISIDNLWEICQYVLFTWEKEPILLENQHKPYGNFLNANAPWVSRCPKCGKKVEGKQTRYCKYCGQRVRWE